MRKGIKLIIRKYNKVYKGSPWYGDSLKSILNKVDPGKVFVKPSGRKTNSIAEITAHIIGWREFKLTQKDTFNWKRIDKNEKTAWKSLLKKLEENQDEILKVLNNSEDELLLMKVPQRKFRVKYLLEGVIQHDIYHIGQIAALNKTLQKEY